MTRILIWAILFAIAVAVVMGMQSMGGAVTIWWSDWRIDFALSTAIFILIGLAIVHLLLTQLLRWIGDIPERFRRARLHRKESKRIKRLADLALDFTEGRYARVTKAAEEFERDFDGLEDAKRPVQRLVAVMAAKASHEMRDMGLRARWMKRLEALSKDETDHPHLQPLTLAQFALDERDGRAALQSLDSVLQGERRQIHTLRQVMKAYQLSAQWPELIRITKLLENRSAISHILADHNREVAARGMLSSPRLDRSQVRHVMDLLSKDDLHRPGPASVIARAMLKLGQASEARRLIEASLKVQWDDRLLEVYADCEDDCPAQLAKVEEWSRERGDSFAMSWALGRLHQKCGQAGKAGLYLEQALEHRQSVRALLALADWAEAQSDTERARDLRQRALAASVLNPLTAPERSAAPQY
jgi:HemY protein